MNKLLVSASVALGATSLSFAQQTEKPNFLLFIADDCSHYDLGCYGSVDSKTPNIDRFATQGSTFHTSLSGRSDVVAYPAQSIYRFVACTQRSLPPIILVPMKEH